MATPHAAVSSQDSAAERFRRVAADFSAVAAAVPADHWDDPAPCEGWVARDVVGHLVGWVPAFLRGSGVPLDEEFGDVAADPFRAWEALSGALQRVLDDPASADAVHDFGPPGRMPTERAISMIVTGDVLIHTWDLARATGQEVRLDPVLVEEMYAGMQPMDEMLRASGHYGPKVAVSDDAPVQTKLIAFTGRTP